jgi:hypothetical protein
VKASALTDESGAFAIDWLEGEGTYDLALTGHRIVASNLGTRVTLPGSDDLRLLEIAAVEEEENDRRPGCGNCDEHALPGSALALPGALFTELAARQVLVVSSWDPNEKRGPEGEGKNRLIPADEPVEYTIHFENRPQATAAAEVVEVFDTLDGDLDCATIRLLDLQIGNVSEQRVALDTIGTDLFSARNRALGEERYSAAGELEVAPSGRMVGQEDAEVVQVDYTVARDPECSTVRWVLALRRDASAGEDAAEGFLPRNCTETCPDCSAVPDGDHPCKDGRGEGHITFSVMPLPGLPEETEIVNDARVLFDGFPDPEAETQWVNRISYFLPPGMPAHPLPADNEESVETGAALQWEAPGADEFDVLLWREGTPQALVSEGRRERFHRPSGGLSPGTRYFWTVVARNENDEVQPPAPWSFTTARPCANPGAPSQPDPPVGAVGVQDCALAWSPGNGARAHEVFLWQGDQRPKTPVATGLVESRFDGRLALVEEAEYRWQVVSLDGACRTEGPVWRFRTREKQFRRGDADGSGGLVNLTDGIFLLNYLYLGGPVPPCQRSADSENDDDMDLTDVVRLLNHLYLGGPEPPAPGPNACGADPEPAAAALTCECYPPCQSS